MSKSILIDCSTLRAGGGVQVALSFLDDLFKMQKASQFDLYISRELYIKLEKDQPIILRHFKSVKVRRFPYFLSILAQALWYARFDIVFCVFGPAYFIQKPKKLITGFARPALIYPSISASKNLTRRLTTHIKMNFHSRMFQRSDHIISETVQVKNLICRLGWSIEPDNIHVVNNCLSSDFKRGVINNIRSVPKRAMKTTKLRLLYVGANYKHKNLNILSGAFSLLKKEHGVNAELTVTMSPTDYKKICPKLKRFTSNIGYVTPCSLGSLMKSFDALIFPSLLECFSITPIEAMYCRLPIICSDREFIREFCADVPFYFDPRSEISIAKAIIEFVKNRNDLQVRLDLGERIASVFQDSKDRTNNYLDIIDGVANYDTGR